MSPGFLGLQTKMWYPMRIKRSESGLTLIELVVALVLIGVIFPTFFSLAGMATVKASKFILLQRAQYFAESKIEEIVGFKQLNWDWYKNIETFAKTENLEDGFVRTVTITKLSKWGKGKIDCWQVTVKISHPNLENDLKLSIRLTKYYEVE